MVNGEQLPLQIPRGRVRLEDAEPARGRVRLEDGVDGAVPSSGDETVEVTVRADAATVARVLADPEGAARAVAEAVGRPDLAEKVSVVRAEVPVTVTVVNMGVHVDIEAVIGYTPWETKERPPCPGYWEVTDHATGATLDRWWYDGGEWWIVEDVASGMRRFVSAAEFPRLHAWRGLRAPHLDGYAWDVTPGAREVRFTAVSGPGRPRARL